MIDLLSYAAVLFTELHMMKADPRSVYYLAQALSYFAVYSAVFIGSGVSLWRLGSTLSNCALRPTIVPVNYFLLLLNSFGYLSGCLLIPCLVLAAEFPDYFAARLVAAVCATAFHLSDCSRTGAHNGYLMIWNVWTFCFLPLPLSLGLAFGAAVWFILSSGFSKLWIGGMAWCCPDTMKSILSSFVYKTPKAGGPVLNILCRAAIACPCLCGAMGAATVVFEVIYVPLVAVFAPRGWQIATAYLMLLLHFGIAIVHSSAIGVFFLPNVASYVVGFYDFESDPLFRLSSPAADDWQPFQGYSWFIGVLMNIIALLYTVFTRKLIAENWPLTPMALFPWNGEQWRLLHSAFVEGNTRMIAVPPEISDRLNSNLKKVGSGGSDVLSQLDRIFIGAPVVPIVGAAKLRDDEDSSVVMGNGNGVITGNGVSEKERGIASASSLWKYVRHQIFGTSPFAKDLRAYAISKSKKNQASASTLTDPLLAGEGSPLECIYLYDIWTRVLGPTTFQEEFLRPLADELFAVPGACYDFDRGLPVLMKTIQEWLQKSERIVEVSSGRTIVDCAFVRVDGDDVVEKVLTWGSICM
eukprot:gnl/TRDRNA2_/TRDRNA2_29640_c0_seq1.p1 gnl/TRDRNA2_/TRDRNA2_29640_c0~~gnl/TRDRNA2_/TRDRNA2_29640_c0_seq1.p1  ORF type:complete len:581 (+),score=51.23 gnl/TRDRNA2_/TRDRNA2_29640_c0_seq1:43-1785(+)